MTLLRRSVALILLLAILCSALSLTACMDPVPSPDGGTDKPQGSQGNPPKEENNEAIYIPPFMQFPDRETVAFDQIVYTRPDYDAVIARLGEIERTVTENVLPYAEQLTLLRSLDETHDAIKTAYAYVTLMGHKDVQDTHNNEEKLFVTTGYPAYSDAVENLIVACARSEHAREFERDYFKGDISSYADGGRLTPEVVTLLEQEAELEASYTTLPDTVILSYKSFGGTYNEIAAEINARYRPGTQTYLSMMAGLELVYNDKVEAASCELYVSLVKVRKQIADALGDKSYLTFAYEANGYEYTPEQMESFLDAIKQYVIPIRIDQEFAGAYYLHMKTAKNEPLATHNLVNSIYTTLQFKDPELSKMYRYMLQYGLFDIAQKKDGRFDGAFTTYFPTYDAPYLFATTDGVIRDYLTVCHEFGHFADMFVNDGQSASLDLCEVYSQGLEYMMILALRGVLGADNYKYLKFAALFSAIETLIYQGYFSSFEMEVYRLSESEITVERLNEIAKSVAADYGFNSATIDLYDCLITHTVLYPTYVQSYCTSTVPALELYLLEEGESGAGFATFAQLLAREGTDERFVQTLTRVGLSDPFKQDTVKHVANEIYFQFLGKRYYSVIEGGANAA